MKRLYWPMIVIAGVITSFSVIVWLLIPVNELTVHMMSGPVSGFLILAGLNRLGCCFNIKNKFLDRAATYLFLIGGFSTFFGITLFMAEGMSSLMLFMTEAAMSGLENNDGGISTLGKIGLFGFELGGFIALAIAFFIRGMVYEEPSQELRADQPRR